MAMMTTEHSHGLHVTQTDVLQDSAALMRW